MPRIKWTTNEQEEWLKDRCEAFKEAEEKDTRKSFYKQTYAAWLIKWPNPEPDAMESANATSREAAIKKIYVEKEKQLQTWYRNRKRPTQGGNQVTNQASKGLKGAISLKKRRLWQPVQAYQDLTYEQIWKPIIDVEWEYHLKNRNADNQGEVPDKNRFVFMNHFMRDRYNEEDEEMKQRVEEHRQAKSRDASPEDTNDAYDQAIAQLPRFLASTAESLQAQTGWFMTVIMGGPVPSDNGRISTIVYNKGQTKDGRDFEEYLGKQDFHNSVATKYDDFLHEAFSPEDRALRAMREDMETNDSPEDCEYKIGLEDEEKEGDDSQDIDEEKLSKKGKSSKMSDYARRREENIARNRELLKTTMGSGYSELIRDLKNESASKKKTVKNSKNTSTKQAAGQGMGINTEGASSSTIANDGNATQHTSPISSNEKEPATHISGDSATGAKNNDATQRTSPIPSGENESVTHMSDDSASGARKNEHGAECTSSLNPSVEDESLVLGSNCDGGSLEQKDNDVLMQGDGGSIEQKDNNVFIEDDMTTKKSQDSQPASASEIATTDSVGAPKFLSAPIMRYLREISDAEAWQALITEYFAFEKGGYPVGKFSTDQRPEQVGIWIKRHINKKHDPITVKLDDYEPQFCSWWSALQPSWRILPNRQYSREVPADETWANLQKSGSSGIYVAIMALSWWAHAVIAADTEQESLWSIVDDFRWVLKQLCVDERKVRKRSRSDSDVIQPRPTDKRRRR